MRKHRIQTYLSYDVCTLKKLIKLVQLSINTYQTISAYIPNNGADIPEGFEPAYELVYEDSYEMANAYAEQE